MPNKDYMKDYRERNEEYRNEQNKRNRARSRALEELKRRHMKEFTQIFEQELKNA